MQVKSKICRVCGNEFIPHYHNVKICSLQCQKEQGRRATRKCYSSRHKKVAEYNKIYRHANLEKVRKLSQKWEKENRSYRTSQRKIRYHLDEKFRLTVILRNRFYELVSKGWKSQSVLKLLGCSLEELKSYLEGKFREGMNWENHGQWHIDHIKPCSSFDLSKKEEREICFNYKNLQPLWALDNLVKGSNG